MKTEITPLRIIIILCSLPLAFLIGVMISRGVKWTFKTDPPAPPPVTRAALDSLRNEIQWLRYHHNKLRQDHAYAIQALTREDLTPQERHYLYYMLKNDLGTIPKSK